MSDQLPSIEGLTDAEIAKATREGRLDAILSGDLDAIAEAKGDALVAEREAAAAAVGFIDQGARSSGPPKYDAAWLATASDVEIARATREGKLSGLL